VRLDISSGDDGASIEANLPWAFVECLLGRPTTIDERSFLVRVKVTGEGGGTFEFHIG
jgi:hypothetical protein